nr:cellulose biosynthesis regulator diguanylate cyclase DgcQ [uncultured Enterobacter sp.]
MPFLSRYFVPGRVVNLCFVIVLVSSTLLTWRQVVVLHDAYVTGQRNTLEKATSALDRQMQMGVNLLLFFRNGMQEAMQTPLDSDLLRTAHREFDQLRTHPSWQIDVDNRRTLAINGISDAAVAQAPRLNRDIPGLNTELTAALELGYIMRLSAVSPVLPQRALYVSRAGFYVTTDNASLPANIAENYDNLLHQRWFVGQSERDNRARAVRWFSTPSGPGGEDERRVIASVPLDYARYWYGVLAIEFSVASMKQRLDETLKEEDRGEYQLFDDRMDTIASAMLANVPSSGFSEQERAKLIAAMEQDTAGTLRLGTRFISWQHLKHFDGTLVRVQSLRDGLRGDFGTISIVLTLLWLLFTTMLLISWGVIRRMVSNMFRLQHSLQWQAWHDALTRLCNRGALFEQAKTHSEACARAGLPFSVIQIDLDHFKRINDRYGHQAGDLVLKHASRLIRGALGDNDVAGRVGGEEFCVILPGSTLLQATAVAERIRERLARKEILVHSDQTLRVSASLGVSSAIDEQSYAFELLQSVADERLYLAKRAGRNQVCAGEAPADQDPSNI